MATLTRTATEARNLIAESLERGDERKAWVIWGENQMIEVFIRNGIGLYGYSFRTNCWNGVFAGIGPSSRIAAVRVRGNRILA
jgi:hypothetical protein